MCCVKCHESQCRDLCSLCRYLFTFFPRFGQSSLRNGSEDHVLQPKEASSFLVAIPSVSLRAPSFKQQIILNQQSHWLLQWFYQSYYWQKDNIVSCSLCYLFVCICAWISLEKVELFFNLMPSLQFYSSFEYSVLVVYHAVYQRSCV